MTRVYDAMLTLTLDGAQLTVDPTLTLLQIAKQHHIDIPSLCGDNDRAPKTPCDLCVVEIAGVGIRRACETHPSEGMVVTTQSQALRDHRQQALGRILSDHYADCEAPCQRACPAGVDIQSYLHHIAMGDHEAATAVIKQTLPMPLSIGRVCPAFCEAECRRSLVDEPLAIRQLKRHAADLDLAGMTPYHPPKKPAKGKRVAIIGSGPGGSPAVTTWAMRGSTWISSRRCPRPVAGCVTASPSTGCPRRSSIRRSH
ncbi:2Fe-2S iron-sulfur cluster-binding protein [Aeromonas enteropelogenes]|uniref:2Fe-2S iron-sulfur cluster-binding protein n=1 Tax=Aeromonas enteropelogenes TaxID=29489 RepID=UPI003F791AA6